MKVHHINCATLCPRGGRFIYENAVRTGSLLRDALTPTPMVCRCLLIESNDGLVLVDTGFGLRDVRNPWWRLGPAVVALLNPRLDEAETAVRQVERLGFSPRDVRHIIPTHLDLDHAGGLPDFPWATVHVFEPEFEGATRPATLMERGRYRATQWSHRPRWKRYELAKGEAWLGFECVRGLAGLAGSDGDDLLLVPTVGHTRGHVAVAVKQDATATEPEWLLHCGDAYFTESELDPAGRRCPPLLDIFQRVDHHDGRAWRENQERLRGLARDHRTDVRLICAHDAADFERQRGVD
jgi:glyoxylase-like metal-dependent hydrolase (beta-lactamase superfamily II)